VGKKDLKAIIYFIIGMVIGKTLVTTWQYLVTGKFNLDSSDLIEEAVLIFVGFLFSYFIIKKTRSR